LEYGKGILFHLSNALYYISDGICVRKEVASDSNYVNTCIYQSGNYIQSEGYYLAITSCNISRIDIESVSPNLLLKQIRQNEGLLKVTTSPVRIERDLSIQKTPLTQSKVYLLCKWFKKYMEIYPWEVLTQEEMSKCLGMARVTIHRHLHVLLKASLITNSRMAKSLKCD
jgi:hypothetical protein